MGIREKTGKPVETVSAIAISVLVAAFFLSCANVQERAGVFLGKTTTKPQMKKYVTKDASFVLYMPGDWRCSEAEREGYRELELSDANGDYEVVAYFGRDFSGGDAVAVAKQFIAILGRDHSDLQIADAKVSAEKNRLVFDGTYSDPQEGAREFRSWASVGNDNFICSRIVGPSGKLESKKKELLTILSNVQAMKGAFEYSGPAPVQESLSTYRLSDGSCSFKMPQDWKVQEIGKTQFVAYDAEGYSFTSANADCVTPVLGLQNSPIPVSDYLVPHEALKFLGEQSGLLTKMNVIEVNNRPEIAQAIGHVYTVGKVTVEDFLYTCRTKEGLAAKGYTLGFSFDTRLGTNWSFRHLTVIAPEDKFDAYTPTFAAMMGSYTIDQEWARNYVAQGQARLRQMQQQTSELVARNSQEIHDMMNAAYQERQTSQDYIDYQRTSYIRGEQDWVSDMEGGTVYHTDSWGTKNTATGENFEGQPYNYVNFTGQNPKYNEQMTSIDSRQLWEQHVR